MQLLFYCTIRSANLQLAGFVRRLTHPKKLFLPLTEPPGPTRTTPPRPLAEQPAKSLLIISREH